MTLLKMDGITKVFPGVRANDQVTFDLAPGEIHALVGENGAGKTTLMKILYGLYRPDSGTIRLRDQAVSIKNPRDAIARGIGMVHQHFMLVPPFTVLENIILGKESQTAGVLRLEEPAREITGIMNRNGLPVDLSARVEDLPVGLQQRVEILKILYRGAEVLVFDEPTAVLTPQEVVELFKTFRKMRDQGKGLIFISHKLDEVLEIADRITVIRRGPGGEDPAAGGGLQAVDRRAHGGQARVPERGQAGRRARKGDPGGEEPRPALTARQPGARRPDAFRCAPGRSTAWPGWRATGRASWSGPSPSRCAWSPETCCWRAPASCPGTCAPGGTGASGTSPRTATATGCCCPSAWRRTWSWGGTTSSPSCADRWWTPPRCAPMPARASRSFDIRTPSELTPAHALSGGNQQKVIVAREMRFDPILLVASQPTRGVDVGATEFIYQQLVAARSRGKAVLLVSADLDEVLSLSDRIGVIFKGKIIKEFRQEEATKEQVGLYMTGEKQSA